MLQNWNLHHSAPHEMDVRKTITVLERSLVLLTPPPPPPHSLTSILSCPSSLMTASRVAMPATSLLAPYASRLGKKETLSNWREREREGGGGAAHFRDHYQNICHKIIYMYVYVYIYIVPV